MRRSSLLLVTVTALGCSSSASLSSTPDRPAPATAARVSTLDDGIAEDMARDNALPWRAGWRLTWADFKGAPPKTGEEGARTAHGIYSAWSCRGETFSFRVRAAFIPGNSWVKPVVLREGNESARVLRHEQAHFDLSEVYARRLRRHMRELRSPCAMKDGELGAVVRRHIDEEKAAQRRYDDETNHSLRVATQTAWEARIARWLAEVASFAS